MSPLTTQPAHTCHAQPLLANAYVMEGGKAGQCSLPSLGPPPASNHAGSVHPHTHTEKAAWPPCVTCLLSTLGHSAAAPLRPCKALPSTPGWATCRLQRRVDTPSSSRRCTTATHPSQQAPWCAPHYPPTPAAAVVPRSKKPTPPTAICWRGLLSVQAERSVFACCGQTRMPS